MDNQIKFGYGKDTATLNLSQLSRHGVIAGATGTGKTISLKVVAEQLSLAGIPVFMSDIKGDLASLLEPGDATAIQERLTQTQYQDYQPQAFPVEIWDAYGEAGIPLRVTIGEMGPLLLAKLLGLNDIQTSILNVVFKVADEQGLLLIDIPDLRAMLNYVADSAQDLSQTYGTISKASIGVILRSLVVLEQQGGNIFFSEPSLEIEDFMRTNEEGKGIINIVNAQKLFQAPTLYATVLLALLSEIYDTLPEVGDLDKPKLVFFFDEAHVLFHDTPKVLLDKIELMVRLIRSKGVGVFFVTQNPMDIPDIVASQLGNRIQHGLRAFTPKELKVVKAVSETFRQDASNSQDLEAMIQVLAKGEAVVSTLQEDGTPSVADKVMIYPPLSKIGTVDPQLQLKTINQSPLLEKYSEAINRESAHEQINQAVEEAQAENIQAADQVDHEQVNAEVSAESKRIQELEEELAKHMKKKASSSRRTDSNFDRFTKNMMSQVGREVGRVITRSITGMWKK